jgi:hypothetical protein
MSPFLKVEIYKDHNKLEKNIFNDLGNIIISLTKITQHKHTHPKQAASARK